MHSDVEGYGCLYGEAIIEQQRRSLFKHAFESPAMYHMH